METRIPNDGWPLTTLFRTTTFRASRLSTAIPPPPVPGEGVVDDLQVVHRVGLDAAVGGDEEAEVDVLVADVVRDADSLEEASHLRGEADAVAAAVDDVAVDLDVAGVLVPGVDVDPRLDRLVPDRVPADDAVARAVLQADPLAAVLGPPGVVDPVPDDAEAARPADGDLLLDPGRAGAGDLVVLERHVLGVPDADPGGDGVVREVPLDRHVPRLLHEDPRRLDPGTGVGQGQAADRHVRRLVDVHDPGEPLGGEEARAVEDGTLAGEGRDDDPGARGAGAGHRHDLAVGARAQEDRVARQGEVRRMLDGGEGGCERPRGRIAAAGGDVVRRCRRRACEREEEEQDEEARSTHRIGLHSGIAAVLVSLECGDGSGPCQRSGNALRLSSSPGRPVSAPERASAQPAFFAGADDLVVLGETEREEAPRGPHAVVVGGLVAGGALDTVRADAVAAAAPLHPGYDRFRLVLRRRPGRGGEPGFRGVPLLELGDLLAVALGRPPPRRMSRRPASRRRSSISRRRPQVFVVGGHPLRGVLRHREVAVYDG